MNVLRRLLSGKIESITVAAMIVAVSSLLSRFLGIFRDRILASEFGAGDALDIYYAAFRIPDLIFNLLVLGALSAGFVPVLTSLIKDDKCRWLPFCQSPNKEAWNLANRIINQTAISVAFLCLLGVAFTEPLMRLVAPGFSGEKFDSVVELARIMFWSPFFLSLSSVFGGILQSFRRFFAYSLSPVLYNLGIIVGALYLVPAYGLKGLAWGVVIGSALHMLVQLPAVLSIGWRYRPNLDYRDPEVRRVRAMMLPRTLSLAVTQINLLVITAFASTLAGGSLAIFNFANNLQSFPIGIFGISYAVAAFPAFSSAAFDREKLVARLSSAVRQVLFFIVPSTVLLLTLRAQAIRLILGSGSFDWEDTIMTMETLGFFALSLFAQALIPTLVRVYYARHDSKTPFFIGLFSELLNFVLAWTLMTRMGVAGLALAFSIASIFNFVLLWVFLRQELDFLDEKRILRSAAKFSAAAIACGLAVQGTKYFFASFLAMDKVWGLAAQGFASASFGLLVYFSVCSLLQSEEAIHYWRTISRRLPWSRVETDDRSEARGI